MDAQLTASGDIDLSTGDLVLIESATACAQRLRRRLLTFKGEVFSDARLGFPWRERVFTKPTRLDLIKSSLRQYILTDDGVDSVGEVVLSYVSTTRTLSVTFTAQHISGDVITISSLPILDS